MIWLAPIALLGLLVVAGPLLVHLLRRRQAPRVVVPSVRFLMAADEAAVRLTRITDRRLLAIRIGIVAAAALALARPLLLTDSRRQQAADRISRSIVVDASDSVPAVSAEKISAASYGADLARVFESRDLTQGLRRGAAWLAAASPSRREIVVLSDFQLGTLTESDVAAVPQDIGVRFVRLAHREPGQAARVRVLSRGAALDGEIEIEDDRTAVTYSASAPSWTGLSITSSPSDQPGRDALLRVLAEAGVRAADPRQPIALRLRGAQPMPYAPATGDWTFEAGQRLLGAVRDTEVQIRVGSREGTLVVDVDAPAGSLAAARIASAALNARIDPSRFDELESETIADSTLAAWTRAPAVPEAIDWNRTDSSDGRLFWSFALLLLAVEMVLRREAPMSTRRMESHAA